MKGEKWSIGGGRNKRLKEYMCHEDRRVTIGEEEGD